METVVLVVHLFLAIALVIVVLLQRSEGGALGIGGGTMGGLVSARGSANLMTRATGVIAGLFIATSLTLAILAGDARTTRSILDRPAVEQSVPVQPAGPVVPLAK